MKRLAMLSAVTRINRHEAMSGINDLVVSCGGWIEGHSLFSNIAATFRFVLPAARLAEFGARLNDAGIHFDAASLAALDERAAPGETEAGPIEVAGALSVTFIHDEPDLRRDVPAIPG